MIYADIFLRLVVYVTHYLLTCCTESERSAEYGKTYALCFLITSPCTQLSSGYSCIHEFYNKINIYTHFSNHIL